MAEWSKALDLSSSIRKNAWVRTPLEAEPFDTRAPNRAPGAVMLQRGAAPLIKLSSWPNG